MPTTNEPNTWPMAGIITRVIKRHLGDEGYQKILAEKQGCATPAIYQQLSGRGPMSEKTMTKLAVSLDMKVVPMLEEGFALMRAAPPVDHAIPERIVERDDAVPRRTGGRTRGGGRKAAPSKINPRRVRSTPAAPAPKATAKKTAGKAKLAKTAKIAKRDTKPSKAAKAAPVKKAKPAPVKAAKKAAPKPKAKGRQATPRARR